MSHEFLKDTEWQRGQRDHQPDPSDVSEAIDWAIDWAIARLEGES